MKDRLGNTIDLEVFQCPFRHHVAGTDTDHYIVGLREFADFTSEARFPFQHEAPIPPSDPVNARSGQSRREQLDDHSSSSNRSTEVPQRLATPDAFETPSVMLRHTLLEGMACWNSKLPRVRCCVFHSYVKHAQGALKFLESQKCRTWVPHTAWQCTRCGTMSSSAETACYDAGVCIWCADLDDSEERKLRQKNPSAWLQICQLAL
eukprot:TRINITY_DN15972_c0_g2_i1.p1 TRINITY_DN15972_c0_g2~~TRINITY_DN15972_c0_g2_i1.p1  ORF type:complete len:206 (-),score=24.08 TRINITY_DN15972_c0_g2_i1:33-650(-)